MDAHYKLRRARIFLMVLLNGFRLFVVYVKIIDTTIASCKTARLLPCVSFVLLEHTLKSL